MTEGRRSRGLIWRLIDAFDPQQEMLPRFHHHPHHQQTNAPENHNAAGVAAPAPAAIPATNHGIPGVVDPRALAQIPRNIIQTDTNHLIPSNDKLLIFRALTGIDSVPTLNLPHHSQRSAPNVGIYARVVQAEQVSAKRHRFFNLLINTCLAIQIVAAAAITALGAASGPHSAVTTFGALNTIMAGVLTYLNGSGLPDRLKHYQNEWRSIREYIEQRERELCLVDCPLDVEEEIQIVEKMYEGVKREIESTKSGGGDRTPASEQTRRTFMPPKKQQQQQQQQEQVSAPQNPSHSTVSEYGDPEKLP